MISRLALIPFSITFFFFPLPAVAFIRKRYSPRRIREDIQRRHTGRATTRDIPRRLKKKKKKEYKKTWKRTFKDDKTS